MVDLLSLLELMSNKSKNVWGVGLSDFKFFQSKNKKKYIGKNKVLLIFVSEKKPSISLYSSEILPQELYIDGEKLVVDIYAAAPPKIDCLVCQPFCSTRGRYDPLQAGISLASINSTACTFTLGLKKDGKPVGLTNSHCTSALTALDKNKVIGEEIVQPSPFDGGKKDDIVGEVIDLTDISKSVLNTDTAIFTLKREYQPQLACSKIKLQPGWKEPVSMMEVYKSGRTTGCNSAKIIATSACVNVQFGSSVKTFCDTIITTPFSAPGDSGSPIVSKDGFWIAQLFAGSSAVTVGIKAKNIIHEFGLSFY